MENQYKEVYFDKYCESCEHKTLAEENEPCSGCLENPVNLGSHVPVNYKQKNKDENNKPEKD